jgi:hypothetical protein
MDQLSRALGGALQHLLGLKEHVSTGSCVREYADIARTCRRVGTRWVSAICSAAALVTLYFVVTRGGAVGLFLVVFFLLFAVIMDLRKTFAPDDIG